MPSKISTQKRKPSFDIKVKITHLVFEKWSNNGMKTGECLYRRHMKLNLHDFLCAKRITHSWTKWLAGSDLACAWPTNKLCTLRVVRWFVPPNSILFTIRTHCIHTTIAIPFGNVCSDPMNQIIHTHTLTLILKGDINFNCLDRLYMDRSISPNRGFEVSYSLAIMLVVSVRFDLPFEIASRLVMYVYVSIKHIYIICARSKAHLFYCILDYVRWGENENWQWICHASLL